MTSPQILSFLIIAAMLGLFLSGRLRYDLVAALALIADVQCRVGPDSARAGNGEPKG